MAQLSHPYMTTGKTTALTVWTIVSKVVSLGARLLKKASSWTLLVIDNIDLKISHFYESETVHLLS